MESDKIHPRVGAQQHAYPDYTTTPHNDASSNHHEANSIASSEPEFAPIRPAPADKTASGDDAATSDQTSTSRNGLKTPIPSKDLTASRTLSRDASSNADELASIRKVMTQMFGRERRAASEEEKTRHVGVVWKHLTVRGVGLGATLQETNADIFLKLPRFLWSLVTGKRKKKPVKTILDDFTVCLIVFINVWKNCALSPVLRDAFGPGKCLLCSDGQARVAQPF